MSLYSYVENNENLIEGMIEDLAKEILIPSDITK